MSVQIKERPRCRKVIEQQGMKPELLKDKRVWIWDGMHVVLPDGSHSLLISGLQKQMRRMVRDGYFDVTGEIIIDYARWWQLDDLRKRVPFRGILVMRGPCHHSCPVAQESVTT
jgi:hypothetical protein